MNPVSGKWPFWVPAAGLALLLTGAVVLLEGDLGLHGFLLQLTAAAEEAVENGPAYDALPDADWQCALFFGLLLGAFAAAAGGEFRFEAGGSETAGRKTVHLLGQAAAGFCGGACVFAGVLAAGSSIWGEWRAAAAGAPSGWLFLAALLLAAGLTGALWQRFFGKFQAPAPVKGSGKDKIKPAKPAAKRVKGGRK